MPQVLLFSLVSVVVSRIFLCERCSILQLADLAWHFCGIATERETEILYDSPTTFNHPVLHWNGSRDLFGYINGACCY